MNTPTMVYKHPGKHKIHGDLFDYKIVEAEVAEDSDESELDQALADGWFLTTPEALGGVPSDDAEPTRDELKTKAEELGLEFAGNISTKKLAQLVEEALED